MLVLTDHKAIESWATELLDTPSGPAGRRARWHELLSKFDIEVVYVPGKDNVVADALSRWAYPASKAFADVSLHGSEEDDEAMRALIEQERSEEKECSVLYVNKIIETAERVQQETNKSANLQKNFPETKSLERRQETSPRFRELTPIQNGPSSSAMVENLYSHPKCDV